MFFSPCPLLFSGCFMQPPKQLKDFAFHELTFWLSHTVQMLHHENTMLENS